jgi:predicted transcriptional regulator
MSDRDLSRRERQIMEALYTLGAGGAREVARALQEPEAHDSVRVTLLLLEKKGHVRHRVDGRRHVYLPTRSPGRARKAALTKLTQTFFGGSAAKAMVALIDLSGREVDPETLDELERWVREQTRAQKAK